MAWHTEYLLDRTRALAKLEAEYPYLTALLSAKPENAALVRARISNYCKARHAEDQQPLLVENLPYHVVLDPSNVCDLACPLCVQATDPRGRFRRMVDIEDYSRLLDELAGCVIRLDLFNWGEPLLHPHFADLVELASARSIYTRTSSHFSHKLGIKAERLIESGLHYIVASIDGGTNSTYERYRVNGNLTYVLRNLEALISARARSGSMFPLIEWQYLVMDHNVNEIALARDTAKNLGVDVFRYGGARGKMSTKVLMDTPTNVQQSQDLLLSPAHPLSEYDEKGEKRRVEEKERCFWLWGKVALHPDGGISPCWSSWFQSNDYGNWLSGDLRLVWNGQNYQNARQTACHGGKSDVKVPQVCDTCAFNKSFVPTPDGDKEPLPDLHHLLAVIRLMNEAGASPRPDIVRILSDDIAHAN